MKKHVKLILAGVVAVAIVAGGIGYAAVPIEAEAVTATASTVTVTFTEQGVYDYESRYSVYPLVGGAIREVRVQPGDAVKKGDVLAVVDASDFENQILQLQASIAGYEGQIANLRLQEQQQRDNLSVTLESLRGQLATVRTERETHIDGIDSLETQIEIQQRVVGHNAGIVRAAKSDYEDAREDGDSTLMNQTRQAWNSARSVLAQSELLLEQLKSSEVSDALYNAQIDALEAQIGAVNGQMGKSYAAGMQQAYQSQIDATALAITQMEANLGRAEITAPMDGVIEDLPAKDGNLASQQLPAAVIGGDCMVEVFVPVREIDGIAAGDAVDLILDKRQGEEVFGGVIALVEEEAQVKLSALGVEERKVRVLIRPDGSALRPGYTVDVRFTVYREENAVALPKTALFQADGGDFVWAVQDGLLTRLPVEKGVETREGYVVRGLSAGTAVIRDANNERLQEGKRLNPLP
ncbi:biotin/lipoyl-binding protein [Ruminococcaceae bacterium OttesenSCG-928-L11]|nr:biotin/lipoyl-binding protein [Ruminococcaceae bacterium OttesenSCG-928-L11]